MFDMHFRMSIGGKVIDSMPVDASRCKDADYLQALRRLLAIKNQLTIAALHSPPLFYLEVPSVIDGGINK